MRYSMAAAVAVQERFERPGWFERILVLGICAGLIVALAIYDERAAQRETARAKAVIAERAQRAAERSNREAMTAPAATGATTAAAPRTERLGGDTRIVIAGGPGLGPAASIVSREAAADTGAPSPQSVMRRVQGPSSPTIATAIPEPPTTPSVPAPAPAAAPAVTASTRDDQPLLLMLMAALGLSMAGGGLRLISRRSA